LVIRRPWVIREGLAGFGQEGLISFLILLGGRPGNVLKLRKGGPGGACGVVLPGS